MYQRGGPASSFGEAPSKLYRILRRYHARQQVIRKKRCLEAARCHQGRNRCACIGRSSRFPYKFSTRVRPWPDLPSQRARERGKSSGNSRNVNCGSRCALARACARRRHHPDRNGQYRRRPIRSATAPRLPARAFHAPARVCQGTYSLPLRRIGKRGEGKFERISWDEAFAEIGKRLRGAIDTYGNDPSISTTAPARSAHQGQKLAPRSNGGARLMNLVGAI